MTVAFDKWTDAASGSFTHTPVGTPRAVVFVMMSNGSSDPTSVTYGGVAMARVLRAFDSVGETGVGDMWFLGANIHTGPQTVTTDSSGDGRGCLSFTAAADCEVIASAKIETDQADPQIALDSGARSAMRAAEIGR